MTLGRPAGHGRSAGLRWLARRAPPVRGHECLHKRGSWATVVGSVAALERTVHAITTAKAPRRCAPGTGRRNSAQVEVSACGDEFLNGMRRCPGHTLDVVGRSVIAVLPMQPGHGRAVLLG